MSAMHVAGLWRYPVKSLRAEPLDVAELTLDGIAGDRRVHVRGEYQPLTGRSRHQLLTVPASTGPDGQPRVDGHRWDGPEAAAVIRALAGPDARLAAYDGPERFDIANLLVATDGEVAELGADIRRLRPNILIGGVEAGEERGWPGRALAIGDVVIGVLKVRGRCVVTTIDPDSGAQDVDVLRTINAEFGGEIALDSWVIAPGTVRLGDPVTLVDSDGRPGHVGGWIVGRPYAPRATAG
jgi:uncharacterized protein YcbX